MIPPKRLAILAAATAMLLVGCAHGPYWEQDLALPPLAGDPPARVVVADFRQSVTDISVTQSDVLVSTRESVRVGDVSALVAAALRRRGIDAEARSEFSRRELAPDQVMLQGTLLGSPWRSGGRDGANLVLFAGSLLVLGGILPSPLSFHLGQTIEYQLQLVDHEGRILIQIPRQKLVPYYAQHYIWAIPSTERRATTLIDEMPDRIAEKLAPMLAAGGPAARAGR